MRYPSEIADVMQKAETYHSHGLHQEALTVCEKHLLHNRHLQPSHRAVIHESIRRIRSAARTFDQDIPINVSDNHMALIKKGWGCRSTINECLVSAKALEEMGCHHRALAEYRQILKKKYLSPDIIKRIALCLVHLTQPDQFAQAVDRLAKSTFKDAGNQQNLKLLIARQINTGQYRRYFTALCNHLAETNWSPNHP